MQQLTFVPSLSNITPLRRRLLFGRNDVCTSRASRVCMTTNSSTSLAAPEFREPSRLSRRNLLQLASACVASAILPQEVLAEGGLGGRVRDVLFDTKSGSFVPASAISALLQRDAGCLFDRCIVAGEIHDNLRTHTAQLAVIDGARAVADNRRLIVGFEQFYRQHDEALAAYREGKISLDNLFEKTNWDWSWGFDRSLYAGILEYCRLHDIEMRGLNVPRTVVREVSRVGLEGLPDVLKSVLPLQMDLNNEAHFLHFAELMDASHAHEMDEKSAGTLRKFYQAQVLWEEYMSESVAKTLLNEPDTRMVALIGAGHVEGRFGFPDRIEKRCDERPYTIVPRAIMWKREDGYTMPDLERPETFTADVMWYTPV